MVNLLSVPLLLGCGVDYGIFLVSVTRGADRTATPAHVLADLEATCHAIFVANLTSVVGFGGLITGSTPAMQSLGRAVGVGMLACLAATLLFLLPMLLRQKAGGEGASAYRPHAGVTRSP
jgi:predicted RND superfamily exporter protein